ncbi:AcrR family transcriptional regulator [Caulobacter ginsengisoli]|uniref:AcrR family transcriptional regulator n=1 Tax=Caulobacter ginsengisoli TaxID=400775 RepID=A0ABU0IKP2_9CAUL|nr:TetR/AcrR family transcriptional regulator [Caulobacter ginsengisoli]MDQ0462580.1 AcrR family transcriptional regulator [Caulobacter ginsengisoli]
MSDRLSKSRWIRHGLRTLANDGPGALKVAPMSQRLKVSRGSFYWHFKDIGDFRAQLLGSWRERTTDQVIQELETETPGPDRLKSLLRRAFGVRRRLDRAIRAWAAEDMTVAALVDAVDTSRVAYIAGLLTAAGVEPARAQGRAAFLYWAYLGQAATRSSVPAALLDEIAELFESGSSRPAARSGPMTDSIHPDSVLGAAEADLDPKQAALLKKTLADHPDPPGKQLLNTGQEEVFSREEVERGTVEHRDETGKT